MKPTDLDKEACMLLAETLHKNKPYMFGGKSVEQIAKEIPQYLFLSRREYMGDTGVMRNFESLSVEMYDLEKAEKEYKKDVKAARKFNILRMKKSALRLLKHGIIKEKNLGYIVMGSR